MNHRSKFAAAYIGVAFFCLTAFSAALISVVTLMSNPPATVPVTVTPITNKTPPNEIERHFAKGGEYSQAAATAVGMKDGTCYVYTNEVSWLAMECFGGVR